MSDLISEKRKIFVIGHKNPDTDSICSAIGYAYLKNAINGKGYAPARTGEINRESEYVLKRFNQEMPKLFEDVSAQVQDIDIQEVQGISADMTMHDALVIMRDNQISALPVVADNGHIKGLVTINNIAVTNMETTCNTLADAKTPIENVIKTLNGTLICGKADNIITSGKIIMGSNSPEFIESTVAMGDIVICGNRYDTQLCAIEMNAACIIICSNASVAKTIARIAKEHKTTIITTPLDPFETTCTISQSIPVGYFMFRDNLKYFSLTDPIEEVSEAMSQAKHSYFPVIDTDGRYRGMISRRNFMNMKRKQLILVDHNERSQCVDGYKEAEILEIIDHHRISSIETPIPVFFRNQSVGSTATIVSQMYEENGIKIPQDIAGVLCSAIISDTLMFRSPTCTPLDEETAKKLAKIAKVEVETLANEMFEAGENLEGISPEEVFFQDFKIFESSNVKFGVGQGSFMSEKNLLEAKKLISGYIETARQNANLSMVFFLITDIKKESSLVICSGNGAKELLNYAFPDLDEGILKGVISRKKQFIPKMLKAIEDYK